MATAKAPAQLRSWVVQYIDWAYANTQYVRFFHTEGAAKRWASRNSPHLMRHEVRPASQMGA
jgi:hypothetical protein